MTSSNSNKHNKRPTKIDINNIVDPFSYINCDYQYEYANDAFQKFVGRDAGEIIGKTVSELFGIDVVSLLRAELALVFQGESRELVLEYEDHLSGANFIRYNLKPNTNTKGIVTGVYISERDCTHEQKKEKMISVQKERFLNSHDHLSINFEISSDFIFVFKVAPRRELIFHTLNKQAAKFLQSSGKYDTGYEVLGKSFEKVFVKELQQPEESYKLRIDNINKVFDTKKQTMFESTVKLPDNSTRFHQNTFTPTLDEDNHVEFIILNIRNVTEIITAKQLAEKNAQQLSMIYNNTDDIMVLVEVQADHKYYIQSCNDAFNDYGIKHGYFKNRDHCLGLEVFEILAKIFKLSAGQIKKRRASWLECEVSKEIVRYGISTKLEDGGNLYHELTLSPIVDDSGTCTHILSVAKDVTEYQNILRNFRDSENRYKSVVRDQTDYIVRWKKGGIRTFVNDAYCRRFGIASEEAIGTSFYDLIPDRVREDTLARHATLSWNSPKILTTRPVVRLDGTKGWEQWTERALFDDKGNIIEYQSVGTDVSEIVASREKLQEQKQELENLVDNIPGLVYRHALDKFWTLDYISDASREILGYSPEKLTGTQIKKMLASEDEWPQLDEKIAEAIESRSTCVMQHTLRRSDGIKICVLNRYKCIYDEEGNPKFIEGVVVDITAQKTAERRLFRSQGLLSMIYNGTKDALILLEVMPNDKFIIVSANKVFNDRQAKKGLRAEDYLGIDITTYVMQHFGKSKKYADEMVTLCIQAKESEEPLITILKRESSTGEISYTEKTLIAVRNDEGVCTHILETLKDITAQRIAELELLENENRLSLIYNNSNDFMALLKVQDSGFIIESVNQVYESKIRETMIDPFTVEDVIDMQLSYFLHKGYGVPQDDVRSRLEDFKKVKKTKKEITFVTHRLVPSGDWHMKHHVIPILKDGECTHMLWISRSINESVEAQRKLKEAFDEVKRLKQQLESDNNYLKEEVNLQNNFEEMVYTSSVFQNVLNKVEQVANLNVNVLITGETGTGKELVARAIHNLSDRKSRPMIKLNCGAIPRELVESELFGHEKGSFTGAFEKKTGKFELANGSTLFLDEIAEMPIDIQVKLLRVLQDGKFERVGGNETIEVDVRVIAATNRDLKLEIEEAKFRKDLFYRLNVFPLHLPALKERIEDIPPLVEYFIKKFSLKHQRTINFLSQEVMDSLQSYSWPGNVRELENMIERAVITSNAEKIEIPELRHHKSSESKSMNKFGRTRKTLAEIERAHILKILQQSGWKISGTDGAANLLGLKPSTLRDRMKKFDLKRPLAA